MMNNVLERLTLDLVLGVEYVLPLINIEIRLYLNVSIRILGVGGSGGTLVFVVL